MENSTNNQRNVLGKGLASLLPNADKKVDKFLSGLNDLPKAPDLEKKSVKQATQSAALARVPGIALVEIGLIDVNTYQPRRDFDETALTELSESIKANGVIQPLIVRRAETGRLSLIAGERRLRASKLAGLKQVPVVIRQSSDKESLELALIENIQRENLNCIEVALSYFQLIEDFKLTQEEAAKRVGKNRASVANHLRLLKLPEEIINDLRTGDLSFGHGKALLALADSEQRMRVRKEILEKKLSVRDAEQLIAALLVESNTDKKKEKAAKNEDLLHLSQKIGRVFGSKVKIKGSENKGTISFKYFSRSDLDRLVEQWMK